MRFLNSFEVPKINSLKIMSVRQTQGFQNKPAAAGVPPAT